MINHKFRHELQSKRILSLLLNENLIYTSLLYHYIGILRGGIGACSLDRGVNEVSVKVSSVSSHRPAESSEEEL